MSFVSTGPGPVKLGLLPLAMSWSTEAFRRAKARNERAYRRGYRHEAISNEELLFPSWPRLRDSYAEKRIVDLLGPSRAGEGGWFGQWGRFAGVDLSNEHRPGNIVTTIASEKVRDKGAARRHCLLEVDGSGLKLTHPQVVDRISGASRRWDWDLLLVEGNAQQEQLIRWGERLREIGQDVPWLRRCRSFTTSSRKWDDYLGLPGLEVEFSQQLWMVPYGEWQDHRQGCECGFCQLDRQLCLFTRFGPGTETYDELMSLYFAWEAARAGSLQPQVSTVATRSR